MNPRRILCRKPHTYLIFCPPLLPFIITGAHSFTSQVQTTPRVLYQTVAKIPFHPYFSIKDILVFILMFLLLLTLPAYWGAKKTSHQQSHLSQPIILKPDDASSSLSCGQSLAPLPCSLLSRYPHCSSQKPSQPGVLAPAASTAFLLIL